MIYFHWIIFIVYVCVVLATMVTVLMDNRQPAKTMAWVLVLIFVPVVGFVLYFFFGRNTRRERYISEQSMDQLTKRSMLEFAEQQDLVLPEEHEALIKLFASQNWALPFKNNEARIYTDGYGFFSSLLRDIGAAEHHIHLETYIICDDPLGRLVADALADKARAGVEVRFIYDDVGCWNVPGSFFERMRSAGVDVHAFMPVKFPAFTGKVNYRNHRKLCVIDGKTGYIGGMNIADRYVDGGGFGRWRDTHVRLTGPAVAGLQYNFAVDWNFMGQPLLAESTKLYDVKDSDEVGVQLVSSGPTSRWGNIPMLFLKMIGNAKKRIYIQTPYFLPTESMLKALQAAALAKVDVRIMIPRKSDSVVLRLATFSYVSECIKAGIKIYLYNAGMLHAKTLIVDDEFCTTGSTNFDFRSFEHNFECNIMMYSTEVNKQMVDIFLADQKDCLRTLPSTWRNRPLYERCCESLVRLLSPVL